MHTYMHTYVKEHSVGKNAIEVVALQSQRVKVLFFAIK